nr:hypothetical protein [Candidatus Sigynarchaeum springense]
MKPEKQGEIGMFIASSSCWLYNFLVSVQISTLTGEPLPSLLQFLFITTLVSTIVAFSRLRSTLKEAKITKPGFIAVMLLCASIPFSIFNFIPNPLNLHGILIGCELLFGILLVTIYGKKGHISTEQVLLPVPLRSNHFLKPGFGKRLAPILIACIVIISPIPLVMSNIGKNERFSTNFDYHFDDSISEAEKETLVAAIWDGIDPHEGVWYDSFDVLISNGNWDGRRIAVEIDQIGRERALPYHYMFFDQHHLDYNLKAVRIVENTTVQYWLEGGSLSHVITNMTAVIKNGSLDQVIGMPLIYLNQSLVNAPNSVPQNYSINAGYFVEIDISINSFISSRIIHQWFLLLNKSSFILYFQLEEPSLQDWI